jgi:superoxide dismutase, Cu-Zn family
MKAIAIFNPGINNGISGRIVFTQKTRYSNTEVSIDLHGFKLFNTNVHAIHIHEYGDLTDGCKSLGSHYNPYNELHGNIEINGKKRHVGDLVNNIVPDIYGNVNLKYVDNLVKLFGPRNIFGRSVVIHALPDDLGLQGTLINEQFVEYKNLPDRDLQILCGQRNYKDIKTKTQMINKLNKESKSTGNAGQRIAYAIIGISK